MKFTAYCLPLNNKMRLGAWLPHEWGDGYPLGGVLNSKKSFVYRAFSLLKVSVGPFANNSMICAVLTSSLCRTNYHFELWKPMVWVT